MAPGETSGREAAERSDFTCVGADAIRLRPREATKLACENTEMLGLFDPVELPILQAR